MISRDKNQIHKYLGTIRDIIINWAFFLSLFFRFFDFSQFINILINNFNK